jgi:hypothetical protein
MIFIIKNGSLLNKKYAFNKKEEIKNGKIENKYWTSSE